jgi:CheY-like chemotaxis protein
MNLLIVEDNKQMRDMMKSILADLAQAVYECGDGSEAFASYAEHKPNWVLMDIEMKELDGISATRQIMAAFPEAHIVIVTNYDDADLREAARRAGACEYVVKENLLGLRRILSDPKWDDTKKEVL